RRRHTRSKRDWSSDVCSSDLTTVRFINVSGGPHNIAFYADSIPKGGAAVLKKGMPNAMGDLMGAFLTQPNEKYDVSFTGAPAGEIGRASCRERVEMGVGGGTC